jgi:hypothetical protein
VSYERNDAHLPATDGAYQREHLVDAGDQHSPQVRWCALGLHGRWRGWGCLGRWLSASNLPGRAQLTALRCVRTRGVKPVFEVAPRRPANSALLPCRRGIPKNSACCARAPRKPMPRGAGLCFSRSSGGLLQDGRSDPQALEGCSTLAFRLKFVMGTSINPTSRAKLSL